MIVFKDRDDGTYTGNLVKALCPGCPMGKKLPYPACCTCLPTNEGLKVCYRDDQLNPPAGIETDPRYGHN
jgi:hypothetical protein